MKSGLVKALKGKWIEDVGICIYRKLVFLLFYFSLGNVSLIVS